MLRFFYILCILFSVRDFQAQIFKALPKTAFTGQYAGSTGLYTFGVSKVSRYDKVELGLLYGRVPKKFGGINNSLVLKFTYNPFQLDVTEKLKFEPLQTGLFINQNFNEHTTVLWNDKYPKGYYWWAKSTRFHFFLSTQISVRIEKKHIDRAAWYFEANTNDLYVHSYIPNTRSLSLYDIFFFGTGLKLYIH
ncbi:hypothetical protein CNR22_14810 [Sphingobacteriaceae bacterium]|nr:hypothetical protein CNR22_14810 [Sphingobacteriaceae bacterium]